MAFAVRRGYPSATPITIAIGGLRS
jgi:hypothetical protein